MRDRKNHLLRNYKSIGKMSIKLLFLTYDIPYPLNSGGKIRSYNLIKQLAKNFDITLYTYYRDEAQKKELGDLVNLCTKIIFFKRSKPWSLATILSSLLVNRPYLVSLYRNVNLKRQLLRDCQEKKFDFFHFESFYPALYLPLVRKHRLPAIMGNENIEYKVYSRYAKQKKLLLKWIIFLEVLRMRWFEERLWNKASLNLAISPTDSRIIERVTKKKCLIIPNGIDSKSFTRCKGSITGNRLLFIGSLKYRANEDAVRYYLENIYPLVARKNGQVALEIVSWYKPSWINKYLNNKSIKFTQDRKKHSSFFFEHSDIFIAPIRVASGTNIKILEAMAGGLPVITTKIGIEGIRAAKGDIIVADSENEFANAILQLVKSKQKRDKLGENGFCLARKYYEWSKLIQPLINFYKS